MGFESHELAPPQDAGFTPETAASSVIPDAIVLPEEGDVATFETGGPTDSSWDHSPEAGALDESVSDGNAPDADASDVSESTPPSDVVRDPFDAAFDSNSLPDANCGPTDSDPLHCGRCGHSCLGGVCVNAICQFTVLSGTAGNPRVFANNSEFLFLVDGPTEMWRRSKVGNASKTLGTKAQNGLVSIRALDIDENHLYFTDRVVPASDPRNARVRLAQCPIDGCDTAPPKVLSEVAANESMGLVVSDGVVYWTTYSNSYVGGIVAQSALMRCNIDGSGTRSIYGPKQNTALTRLALHGSWVFALDTLTKTSNYGIDGSLTTTGSVNMIAKP